MTVSFHRAARREADDAVDWTADHISPAAAVRLHTALDRVVYLLVDDQPTIVAVAHPSRAPGYWIERLART